MKEEDCALGVLKHTQFPSCCSPDLLTGDGSMLGIFQHLRGFSAEYSLYLKCLYLLILCPLPSTVPLRCPDSLQLALCSSAIPRLFIITQWPTAPCMNCSSPGFCATLEITSLPGPLCGPEAHLFPNPVNSTAYLPP